MKRASSTNPTLIQPKYEDGSVISRFALSRFYKTLGTLMDMTDAGSIFDAGCGEGHIFAQFVAPRVPQAYGGDLDMARLRYLKAKHPDYHVYQSDLENIPLPDNAVDLVISLEVLEHVGQPADALREMKRVTRRYGIFSVPHEPFWRIGNFVRGAYVSDFGNTPGHINHWSLWGFKRFVSREFRVVTARPSFLWTFVLAEKV